ncbi:MAG: HAD family hydrolase [Anaerolineales bacterium]|nr:HAD family hydrolase [Anaerolineales bacterium]
MIRALIFDFDGLILETEGPIFRSWQELYQAHGCRLAWEKWATIIGRNELEIGYDPLAELEKQVGKPLERQTLAERRRQREWELVLAQPLQPGVEDYLRDALRLGLKIGLASSSPCQWVTGHLERLGLRDYFASVMAGDDVPLTKPDPAVYLRVLECLGVPGEQAAAFEDSPNGALAAKRAGLFCVVAPNELTRQLPNPHADLLLESLAEMPLEALLARVEQALEDGRLRS